VLRAVDQLNPPAQALSMAGGALERDLDRSGAFITFFHARLDTENHTLRYADAGHGHAFLRKASGAVAELLSGGLPVGILPEQTYDEGTVVMEPRDALVLYSDGLIDARPDLQLDRQRLAAHLDGAEDAETMADRLMELADPANPLPDDVTVVVLRRS
jgi:serine phosphatase RsbU (regulator of sigma subunit)